MFQIKGEGGGGLYFFEIWYEVALYLVNIDILGHFKF